MVTTAPFATLGPALLTVAVTFAPKRARDVPLYVAGLPIFSKAYYANRPFEESTLDAPLGSVQYSIRGGTRFALHGGINRDGVANVVDFSAFKSTLDASVTRGTLLNSRTGLTTTGYAVNSGTSFVMAMEFAAGGGVRGCGARRSMPGRARRGFICPRRRRSWPAGSRLAWGLR